MKLGRRPRRWLLVAGQRQHDPCWEHLDPLGSVCVRSKCTTAAHPVEPLTPAEPEGWGPLLPLAAPRHGLQGHPRTRSLEARGRGDDADT